MSKIFSRWMMQILTVWIILASSHAYGFFSEIEGFVKQYQLGIDYSSSTNTVGLAYDTSSTGGVPKSCSLVDGDPTTKRCSVSMVGGSSSGWGIFLQRAFHKQGFFYLNPDLSFGVRYLNGQLPSNDQSLDGLPLRSASFTLAAAVMKPYIQFGITPDWWPDILISMGPAIQVAAGTMKINGHAQNVAVGTSSISGPLSVINGFLAIELVVKRFGNGALSFITSKDYTGSGRGTKIYPKSVDGMSDFYGTFTSQTGGMAFGFGLKLVTNWP